MNVNLLRSYILEIYNKIVINNNKDIIYFETKSINFETNKAVFCTKNNKNIILLIDGLAVLSYNIDTCAKFVNEENELTEVSVNSSEEEMFQQSLVSYTLGLEDMKYLEEIYNHIWDC